MDEILILVDENDRQIGIGEKMDVHRRGVLHRCFSIFVFDGDGRVMLQKRAASKYHSGGLWTNTCCGHPRDGEDVSAAAHRRLREEMGFDCALDEIFTFIYRAELDHGLTEHELDHVYAGTYAGTLTPNPGEADGYSWEPIALVRSDMAAHPERYTVWSRIAVAELLSRFPDYLQGGRRP
ncbi:MAG: isopentenyl-diphosphate Delta-isomerase [Deltaproteobacteria bacterium]|nr:isopentenyl-diphosphate Delta-isomerase [Deltaproteobacteria bacterium]